ncbi:DUF6397 family protein [Actinacidiphila acididurans]|uniref:DNA-binding protein n=1 Tax=Actinacidiphila acididurans TaxID=2784346 RepID=A0ABS2TZZ4_9ACTN|nr:DUF6397 family protein [Actinacidiphila acididurans]MBM9507533.1 hypothetical protein [Actinacidiphila acididurans]
MPKTKDNRRQRTTTAGAARQARAAASGTRTKSGAGAGSTASSAGTGRSAGKKRAAGARRVATAERVDGELLTLSRARDELGLDYDEFDVAVQLGEVPTVVCGPGLWKVAAADVARLRDAEGPPKDLLDRIHLVSGGEAARMIGIGRERFVKLARTGHVRPVRWYVNRYRALVWMYPAREVVEFAEGHRTLLAGRLPQALRDAVEAGEDQRPRGWRERRVGQLVRDAWDAWDEAAVWAALLHPELVNEAVPDAGERAHLRRLRGALPPGRTGPAEPELVRRLTTADHPDEIATALRALTESLTRARALPPDSDQAAVPPDRAAEPAATDGVTPHPAPRPSPAAFPALGVPPAPGALSLPPVRSVPPVPPVPPPPGRPSGEAGPAATGPQGPGPGRSGTVGSGPGRPETGRRRGLRQLLRGRRSAADLAEEPLLHHGHQKPPLTVEDLAAGQPAGAGRDG